MSKSFPGTKYLPRNGSFSLHGMSEPASSMWRASMVGALDTSFWTVGGTQGSADPSVTLVTSAGQRAKFVLTPNDAVGQDRYTSLTTNEIFDPQNLSLEFGLRGDLRYAFFSVSRGGTDLFWLCAGEGAVSRDMRVRPDFNYVFPEDSMKFGCQQFRVQSGGGQFFVWSSSSERVFGGGSTGSWGTSPVAFTMKVMCSPFYSPGEVEVLDLEMPPLMSGLPDMRSLAGPYLKESQDCLVGSIRGGIPGTFSPSVTRFHDNAGMPVGITTPCEDVVVGDFYI